MARKTRRDRDLERQQLANRPTITIDVYLTTGPPPPPPHEILYPIPPPPETNNIIENAPRHNLNSSDGLINGTGSVINVTAVSSPARLLHPPALLSGQPVPDHSSAGQEHDRVSGPLTRSRSKAKATVDTAVSTAVDTAAPTSVTVSKSKAAATVSTDKSKQEPGLAAGAEPLTTIAGKQQPVECNDKNTTGETAQVAGHKEELAGLPNPSTVDRVTDSTVVTEDKNAVRAPADQKRTEDTSGWQKVLWKEQPYPDNYVDASFLHELVVNARVPRRSYWAVVLDAVAVSLQVSLVAAAALMPMHLAAGALSATTLLVLDAALLILGYAVCAGLGGHLLGGPLARGIRQACLLVGGVYFLSPLLKTLAATISADSVMALSVVANLVHLFLNDYNFVNSATQKLSGTVALAAAALSAVLVASLMPSELHVFVQVLFSLELFLLSPFVWRYIRATSIKAHIFCAVMLCATTSALCVPLSVIAACAYLAIQLFLVFLCPAALIRIHKFKANINGPWDEAVPHMPDTLKLPGN